MPKFLVELNDGRKFQVEANRQPTPEEAMQLLGGGEQPALSDKPYLSQLGEALSTGYGQMTSGVGATFNALTGDTPDVAANLAEMGRLQREQQASRTAEDIALTQDFARSKAAYEQAQGPLETIEALGGYLGATARNPGAAFKQAVQSAPNALISGVTGLAGYGLGGLLGAGAGIETGPGAILTGIAGAAAGGAVSNTLMEAGPAIYDILNERTGGAAANMTADEITAYLNENPDVMSEGLKTGAIRGSVIGLVEGLGLKGAGALSTIPERAAARAVQKTLVDAGVDVASKEAVEAAVKNPAIFAAVKQAGETAKQQFSSAGNLARMGGAAGIEIGASGAGEAGAQMATGREVDPTEVYQEMLGEVGLSLPMALGSKIIDSRKYLSPTEGVTGMPPPFESQIAAEALDATTDTPFTDISGQAAADTIAQNTELAMRMPVQPVEAAEEIAPEVTPLSEGVAVPISESPSPNLPPRATENVEPIPTRKEGESRQDFLDRKDAWDSQYGGMRKGGRTHNDDGTPYQPTVFDEVMPSILAARSQMTDDEANERIGEWSETRIATSVRTLLDAGWTWDAKNQRWQQPENNPVPNESPLNAIFRLEGETQNVSPSTAPTATQVAPTPAPKQSAAEKLLGLPAGTLTPPVTPSLPEAGPPAVDQEAPAGTPVQAAPIQPITTQEDAIQEQIPDEGVLRQERPEMELQGVVEQNVQPEEVAREGQTQEEVITPQGKPTTATEGKVTPRGVATERDLTKPEDQPAVKAPPEGKKSLYQIRAAKGRPATDADDIPTGWKINEFQDAIELVSDDASKYVVFPIENPSSYGDKMRALVMAKNWAIDNPVRAQIEAAPMQANYGAGRVEDVTLKTVKFVHTTKTKPGKGQKTGYYPGTYAYESESGLLPSMEGNRFVGELPESDIYTLKDADQLKKDAADAGFGMHSGNGNAEVKYLQSLGFKAMRRPSMGGTEIIVFDTKDANFKTQTSPPITPPGEPTTATEGKVTPRGVATERDLTKPEQMTPEEFVAMQERITGGRTSVNWQGGYAFQTEQALEKKQPVSVASIKYNDGGLDSAGVPRPKITLPKGYVKQGDLYVFQPSLEQSGLGAGAATTPQGAIESPTAPKAETSLVNQLNAAKSRQEAQTILESATAQQVKEAAQEMGYPATGSKKAVVSRLVAAVGSRADAKAIRQQSPQTKQAAAPIRAAGVIDVSDAVGIKVSSTPEELLDRASKLGMQLVSETPITLMNGTQVKNRTFEFNTSEGIRSVTFRDDGPRSKGESKQTPWRFAAVLQPVAKQSPQTTAAEKKPSGIAPPAIIPKAEGGFSKEPLATEERKQAVIGYAKALLGQFPSLSDVEIISPNSQDELIRTVENIHGKRDEDVRNGIYEGEWLPEKRIIIIPADARPSTIAHEVGHAVLDEYWENADEATKKAIQAEHAAWAKKSYGKPTVADSLGSWQLWDQKLFPDLGAIRKHPKGVSAAVRKSTEDYRTSFLEWAADQFSYWSQTKEQPKSLVDKFFADLSAQLAKIWNAVKQHFTPNATYANWIESLLKPQEAAETQTPESLRVDSGAAGVVQSEPSRGSILEVEKESTKTAIESTGKSVPSGYGDVVNSARKSLKERPADFKTQEQVLSDLMKLPVADLQSAFEVVTGSPTKLANKRQLANNVLNELLAEAQESKPTAAEDTFRKAEREAEEEIQRQNAQSISNLFDKLRTNPQRGQVTRADVNQAIGALQNSGEVPNAIFTWNGTTDDLLRQRATMERQFPGAVAAASMPNVEGVFENGMAFVFSNRVVVTDLDRRKAAEEGTSPSVAAVKRVVTHENMHKGLWLLSPKQQSDIMSFLRQMFPAAELDELAKSYRQYADWRTNPVHEMALLDERLQKYIEETKTIPTDGVWKQFWDYIKEIWRKLTGKPKGEPTLQSMKDVVRLIRSALKNAHKARPDRTIDGGRVLMSVSGGRSFVPAVNIDGRVEIGASHYDAWIKHALRQIPNFKKDGLSEEERRQLADRWIVDHPEFMAYSLRKEGFVSDGEFLNRQDSLKKFKSLGGVQQMAPGEPDRDWLDASDVEGYRFSIAPSPSLPDLKANIQRELDAENEEALKKLVPQSITVVTLEDHVDLDDDGLPSKYYLMTVGGADEAVAMLRSGMPRDQFVWMESSDKSSDKQAVSELGEILFEGFLDKKAFKDVQVNRTTVLAPRGEVSGAMFSLSPVSYASEQDEASSIGQQTARYAASSPRTIETIVGVRQAYASMPKSNGAAVMLDDLFAETAKLVPNLTRPEFDRVIQGMYDDNAVLLNDAQNPSSVTLLPGAMMSMATNEEEQSAAAKFKSAITAAAKGLPDLREYEGRLVKAASGEAIDVEPHNVLWFDGFMKASDQLLSDLQKQGLSLQQIYDKVAMDTEFKRELGLFDEETGSGQAATVLSGLLLQRTLNAARKARTAEAKAQGDALHRKAAAYYSALATARGQNLLMYRLLQNDPRTRFAFMEDKVTNEMLKKAEHGVNVQFGDGYAATQEAVKNAVDASSEAAKTEVADAVENAAEEDQDAIDLAEGEATLDAKGKTLWEKFKDLIRKRGIAIRALNAIRSAKNARQSIAKSERDSISQMSEEELVKFIAGLDSEMETVFGQFVGGSGETTRKKREKMVKTAQKRAQKGKDIDVAKEGEPESSEEQVSKAERTAQAILKDLSERYSDPLIIKEKKPNVDAMRELYKERVKQGVGPNQMTEKSFVSKAAELGADEKTAGILWRAAELEIDAREAMRQDKILQRKAAVGARADAQAHRIIFAKERLKRQSGFSSIESNANKDTIIKAFQEQVKKPVSIEDFIARLRSFNVSETVAKRLFTAAEREKIDQEAMLAYELLSGPDAFKKMAREVNAMRPSAEVPFMKRIPWREILRQPGKTVEEYRRNIFNAVNSNEAFKDLDEAQKRRLSELFAEAWQAQRDKILDSMIEQHTYSLERQQKKEAAKALRDARNQIIEAVNLGAFSNDELTRVLGEKFGFKTSFTEDEKQKLSDLAEKLQDEKMNKAKRNKLAREFLSTLQSGTQIPIAELLSNWWVSAVLSGGNTVSAIASSFLNGTGIGIMGTHLSRALRELMKGNTANAIDAITSLFKAYAEHISSFPSAANRAWQYLWSGDVSFLESAANDPFGRVNTLADIAKYQVVADQVAKDPNKVKAVMGRFMQFMGRLLTALDAFNVMVTKAGTVSLAIRQSGLTPEQIRDAELKNDLKFYKDKIVREDPHFGGKQPTSAKEKAYLNSLAEAEMYADLAEMGVKMENADYLASESAMTMNPTGSGGIVYNAIKALDTKVTSETEKHLDMAQVAWAKSKNAEDAIKLFTWSLVHFFAKQGLNVFGLRFARFAGNKFNQSLSFVPGLGLLRMIEADNKELAGRQEAFKDTIIRNQTLGWIIMFAGWAIIKAIEEEPDDEKRGWFINGGWNNLTPDQKKQKISRGEKQYTIGTGDYVFNYQNWPISQPLAALGALSDLVRFSQDKWKEKTTGGKAGSAVISGMQAALEIPALTQVNEIFANTMASKDPAEQTASRLSRVTAGWMGGFMPRILKDLDYIQDPTMRRYETLFQKAASHVPVYRRYVGSDYYDILGNKIEKNAIPGSRDFMKLENKPEYRMLGALNARGIWLTPANAEYRMVGKGRFRRRLTQEEADRYSLETGKLYRQMVMNYGPRALQMPVERAKDYISAKADDMRDLALQRAVSN